MTTPELRVFLRRWFCGCWSPEHAAATLRDLLALLPRYDHIDEWNRVIPDEGLQCLMLYTLTHFDLAEHGGSVGGSWLTEKGEATLAALRAADMNTLFDTACMHGQLVTETCPECARYDAP